MAMPLIPFTLAWIIGIWLASCIAVPSVAFGLAVGVAILGIILWRRARGPRWVFVLALAVMLGTLRYNFAQPHFDQTSLATYNDQQKSVVVEGIVIGEPDARDAYTNLRVESNRLIIADQPTCTVKELVLIQAPAWAWLLCSASSTDTAGVSGPNPNPAQVPRSISRFEITIRVQPAAQICSRDGRTECEPDRQRSMP